MYSERQTILTTLRRVLTRAEIRELRERLERLRVRLVQIEAYVRQLDDEIIRADFLELRRHVDQSTVGAPDALSDPHQPDV